MSTLGAVIAKGANRTTMFKRTKSYFSQSSGGFSPYKPIFFASAAAFLGVTYFFMSQKSDDIDRTTLCPQGAPPRHVALLIDRTDPWDKTESYKLKRLIERIAADLKIRERVSLYQLEDVEAVSIAPVFSICSPGAAAETDPLNRGAKWAERLYVKQFGAPLAERIEALSAPSSATQSPIAEWIEGIARDYAFADTKGARELHIFSNMEQHAAAPGYSFYRGKGSPEAFAEAFAAAVDGDLAGVSIFVHYIETADALDMPESEARAYWQAAFDAAGADLAWRRL
jgi:hypothetical protein